MSRLERLAAGLEEPLLVTADVNVRYLTGFASSNAALLVEPDATATLYSDFRYAEAARAIEGVRFVETRRNLLRDLAQRLAGRVAFEADALAYAGYETLVAGGVELVPRRGLVESLRAVKDERELDAIRRAAATADAAFAALAAEPFIGRSERELAWRMEELLHAHGAYTTSFPIIVAAGPNGARPHTQPGERRIQSGETVVVDAGAVVDGYCSDCTRTFSTGGLPAELQRAYGVCLGAQLAGLAAVRAGVRGRDADAAARARIEEAGLGAAFGHSLGHGVGLLVHEDPRLSQEGGGDGELVPGNVVTVEPGIYLAGLGGIRIEDLVVVTDDGPEVLSPFTKELLEVS